MAAALLFLTCCKKNDRALVVSKIQKASELTTTEFKVDKLVYGVKDKTIFWVIDLNQAQFLAKSQATIKAGIDLAELKEENVDVKGDKINLKLPPVRVINFSYPAETFARLDIFSSNAFANKITLEDQEKFFRDAELDIRNSLKYMDIRETTEKNTKVMMNAMLRNLGYTEIYIDFKRGDLIKEIHMEGTK